jgi:monoamine oxidase
MADAIIIGAGYAGMSVAALLANTGRKVIVLEGSGMIGGRALSYKNVMSGNTERIRTGLRTRASPTRYSKGSAKK